MSALTRFFFRAPYPAPTPLAILQWWESRRVAYNLAIATAGAVSLGAVTLASLLPPFLAPPPIRWESVVLYGVLANLCYSLGPLADLLVCRRWGAALGAVGPALFRYGLAFAVGLTLLPVLLVTITCAIAVLRLVF